MVVHKAFGDVGSALGDASSVVHKASMQFDLFHWLGVGHGIRFISFVGVQSQEGRAFDLLLDVGGEHQEMPWHLI